MLPEEWQRTLRAYRESRVLLTALEVNLFTALADGATPEEAAVRAGTEPRATGVLLNALASMGIVTKANGRYRNTSESRRCFSDGSPDTERPGLLHEALRWQTWSALTGCVRGELPSEAQSPVDPGRHAALLESLDRKAAQRAPRLVQSIGTAGVRRVLDLGGGSGAYSIAFVRAAEGVEASILELPEIAPLTRRYIEHAGEAARVRVIEGDLRASPFEAEYDLILLFSLTHLFSESENRSLFQRCRRALAPGGRLAIHDHILAEDKTQPRAGALFAVNMLLVTAGGSTYSLQEYESFLRDAGFASVEHRPLTGEPTGLLIAAT